MGDLQELQRAIATSWTGNEVYIHLDSPGGNLAEGVEIGKYIRQHGFRTVIPAMSKCMSACFFVFIGGAERKVEAYGKLGVHQFRGFQDFQRFANEVKSETQRTMAQLIEYTRTMGIDIETIQIAVKTPPQDMYIFSQEEMERFGILTQRNFDRSYEAAMQGNASAQFNLGEIYEQGMDIKQNYEEAARWIQKAADQDYARAQCRLGFFT